MPGIKTAYFSDEEKKLIGNALKELREASELTQKDVAYFLDLGQGASAQVSRFEHGQIPISAEMAYDLITSVATDSEGDRALIKDLFSRVPKLEEENRLRQLINQAREGGKLDRWGTKHRIAKELGGGQSLYQKIRRRSKEG